MDLGTPSQFSHHQSRLDMTDKHCHFVAFALTPFGGMGSEADQFMRLVEKIAKDSNVDFVRRFWLSRLAGKLLKTDIDEITQFDCSFSERAQRNLNAAIDTAGLHVLIGEPYEVDQQLDLITADPSGF